MPETKLPEGWEWDNATSGRKTAFRTLKNLRVAITRLPTETEWSVYIMDRNGPIEKIGSSTSEPMDSASIAEFLAYCWLTDELETIEAVEEHPNG